MPLFGNAQDFLNLRLGLEHEVLGRAAAEDEHAGAVSGGLRFIDNCRRLVDVAVHVEHQLRVAQSHRGDVHPDRTVARAARENGNAALAGRREHGAVL